MCGAGGAAGAATYAGLTKVHSNVFVRNLPSGMEPSGLKKLFSAFGCVLSVRILEPQQVGQQRLGFVKFGSLTEAQSGIKSLHGRTIGKHVLEVKLADSDVGGKSPIVAGANSKLGFLGDCHHLRACSHPENDNLVVTGFPSYWRDADLADLFLAAGIVVETRVVMSSSMRDVVGLVRFSCVEEARQAIDAFHGRSIQGCGPLHVEFASGAEVDMEGERLKFVQRTPSPTSSYELSSANSLTCSASLLKDFETSGESVSTGGNNVNNVMIDMLREFSSSSPEFTAQRQLHELIHKLSDSLEVQKAVASVYVAKLPQDADRLFLYEKFAPFGAVSSVRVLLDENRKCTGVGFVNYVDPACAKRAVLALNGARVAGRDLQVRLQENRRR